MAGQVGVAVLILLAAALAAPAPTVPTGAHEPGPEDPIWRVVTFDGPIDPAERAALEARSIRVADYVPPFGYLVLLSQTQRDDVLALPHVRAVDEIPLGSKSTRLPVVGAARVLPFPGEDPARLARDLLSRGASAARVVIAAEPMVDVELGTLTADELIAHPRVRWVEARPSRIALDNENASSIVQSGTNGTWPVHERGVNGSTQVVGYCDTGLDTDAPMAQIAGRTLHEQFVDGSAPLGSLPLVQNLPSPFHRKVALYYAPIDEKGLRGDLDDMDGHGTHVAGTLAGDAGARGARDGNDGVAYAARLAVCDAATSSGFQLLADYAGYWDPAYEAGARVHSNSWGVAPTGEYTLAARQHDAYLWEHRDLVIVRSVGNTGENGPRAEAVAKNVLAVGATSSDAEDERVMDYSGRGPAADGRVKPDLVAPGDRVCSAALASPNAYVCLRGTSQATPVVAGAAALIRDYFAKGFYPTGAPTAADGRSVSSALVRALLVASAVPVSSEGPDGVQGWGRPQLDTALAFTEGPVLLLAHDEDAALTTGGAWETTFDVSEGASLRVVLAWTDAPAALGAESALVNDLDLEVVTPSGALHVGRAASEGPDRTNVLERVVLLTTEAGAYTLRVRGWNVPVDAQPFALAAIAR